MPTPALQSPFHRCDAGELGSTGELRPGLRYVPQAVEKKSAGALTGGTWLWALAVALAIGSAALRALG